VAMGSNAAWNIYIVFYRGGGRWGVYNTATALDQDSQSPLANQHSSTNSHRTIVLSLFTTSIL